jgi:hypothetical protein
MSTPEGASVYTLKRHRSTVILFCNARGTLGPSWIAKAALTWVESFPFGLCAKVRHARACPGHPRLYFPAPKTWMAGTSPAMTKYQGQANDAHPQNNLFDAAG